MKSIITDKIVQQLGEKVWPVLRSTKHGTIAIFVYDLAHRVYVIEDNKLHFLYQRANVNLAACR